MQANLTKVAAQLTSRGGKYGVWAAAQLQTQADALKKIPIVGGESLFRLLCSENFEIDFDDGFS